MLKFVFTFICRWLAFRFYDLRLCDSIRLRRNIHDELNSTLQNKIVISEGIKFWMVLFVLFCFSLKIFLIYYSSRHWEQTHATSVGWTVNVSLPSCPVETNNILCFVSQVNELRTRIKELSPTENIFLTATMQFRETIKGMYSLQVSSLSLPLQYEIDLV